MIFELISLTDKVLWWIRWNSLRHNFSSTRWRFVPPLAVRSLHKIAKVNWVLGSITKIWPKTNTTHHCISLWKVTIIWIFRRSTSDVACCVWYTVIAAILWTKFKYALGKLWNWYFFDAILVFAQLINVINSYFRCHIGFFGRCRRRWGRHRSVSQ